jgi:hypothetical protein
MSRFAALLSLVAALSGTPLRQAEAASDLSRALAESFQADRLEAPDGGVGDDSGVTIRGDSQAGVAIDMTPTPDSLPLPTPAVSPRPPGEAEGLWGRAWWTPDPPNLRCAWLQVFLF